MPADGDIQAVRELLQQNTNETTRKKEKKKNSVMNKITWDILRKDNTQSPCVSPTETSPMSIPNLSSFDALNCFSQNKQESQNSYDQLEETFLSSF